MFFDDGKLILVLNSNMFADENKYNSTKKKHAFN